MLNRGQLRALVKETLKELNKHSPEAEELVLMTIAHESHLGTYIRQVNGPALGIVQMEPATHDDIWNNYLQYKPSLALNVLTISGMTKNSSKALVFNLKYAIAMCRIHYLRVKGAIPKDTEGQAKYAKDHYNTHLGAAKWEDYGNAWETLVKL